MFVHEGVVHIATTFNMPQWGMLCAMVPLHGMHVEGTFPSCLLCIGIQETLDRASALFLDHYNKKIGR